MTKKQRKIFSKGAEELQENDEVVKQCLQDKQYTATGKMFFIGNSDVASSLSSDARFEQAKIIDPYYGENVVKLQWRKKLESQFLEQKPTFPDYLVPWRSGLLAGSGKRPPLSLLSSDLVCQTKLFNSYVCNWPGEDCKPQFVQSSCLRKG